MERWSLKWHIYTIESFVTFGTSLILPTSFQIVVSWKKKKKPAHIKAKPCIQSYVDIEKSRQWGWRPERQTEKQFSFQTDRVRDGHLSRAFHRTFAVFLWRLSEITCTIKGQEEGYSYSQGTEQTNKLGLCALYHWQTFSVLVHILHVHLGIWSAN